MWCVFNHSTGRNFYPIVTQFGKQVGLVKIQDTFEDGLYGSYTDPRGTTKKQNLDNFSTTSPIFDLKVSLDRIHLDLKFCLWKYPLKVLKPAELKNQIFEIYDKFCIF